MSWQCWLKGMCWPCILEQHQLEQVDLCWPAHECGKGDGKGAFLGKREQKGGESGLGGSEIGGGLLRPILTHFLTLLTLHQAAKLCGLWTLRSLAFDKARGCCKALWD